MALTLQTLSKTEFASPPGVYFELEKVLNEEDGTFEELSKVIESDPPLAARLLKIVNSPCYGMMGQVETIAHAIGIIGRESLAELAMVTSAVSKFDNIPREQFDMEEFWSHSLESAFAAQLVARHKEHPKPEQLYLAGMLHDLGQLVIMMEEPDKYSTVRQMADESIDKNLVVAEKKVLRYDHAQIGGAMLKEWKLPATLHEAVTYHHDPMKAPNHKDEACILHVAELLAYEIGFGKSCEPALPDLHKDAIKVLNVNLGFIYKTKNQIKDEITRAASVLS